MSKLVPTITEAAIRALEASDPAAKCAAADEAAALSLSHAPAWASEDRSPPRIPARPPKPRLADPTQMPKRRLGTVEGRIALLHAIAHIEFNAIDLAFDMLARFTPQIAALGLDASLFAKDWAAIGTEEARHFRLVCDRLDTLGATYGDLPAHGGLWEAAAGTSGDVLARLVVAPLILEARGLDVTPGMIKKLNTVDDRESAAVLQVIYDEEIGHVAAGERWFHKICKKSGKDAGETFVRLQQIYFPAGPKPPFNHEARARAGLSRGWYEPN